MPNKFRKRSQADTDMDQIWSYIAADNIEAADNLINRIGTVFEMLVQNPLAGRERAELAQLRRCQLRHILYRAIRWH